MTQSEPSIWRIPLDAWVVILRYVNRHNLVEVFDNCFHANVFGVRTQDRVDTFWIVMTQARLLDEEGMPGFDLDATPFHTTFRTLLEFGVCVDSAKDLVRRGNGSLDAAMHMLGWD